MSGVGRVGSHAARVGAFVVVVGGLVVLGGFERDDGAAIDDGEDARLLADQALFDHDPLAGLAERLVDHDVPDGGHGFLSRGADDDPFAGGQAVGLDDQGPFGSFFDVGRRGGCVVKDGIIRGRDVCQAHEVLGEGLAPFQFGRLAGRTEDEQAGILEGVDHAGGERRLWPDDGQVDLFGLGELDQPCDVVGVDIEVLPVEGRAGVARGAEDVCDQGRPGQLPDERMLAASIPNHQYFHRT